MPLSSIDNLLRRAQADYVFSAYQLASYAHGQTRSIAGGRTSWWSGAVAVDPETLFDIGSVTKAVVGASLTARALQAGKLSLEDPIDRWLPPMPGGPFQGITIQHLLSHTSGLKAWVPWFRETSVKDPLSWVSHHAASLREARPGARAVYSDVGFWLLRSVLEKVWAAPIAEMFEREVRAPLALPATGFQPVKVADGRAVATEYCLWRKRLLAGEVFDENCAAMGGVGAHAGLFSTADSLARWCAAWLGAVAGTASDWLRPEIAQRFVVAAPNAGAHAYGWQCKSRENSFAGTQFSAATFGHLGFPGASVWLDPEAGAFSVLLTNRIHPSRYNNRFRKVSAAVNDALAERWRSAAW